MPVEGKGTLYKRKDGKYLLYIPKDLAEDSQFPFQSWGQGARGGYESIPVKVRFVAGVKKILVEEWTEPDEGATDEESD